MSRGLGDVYKRQDSECLAAQKLPYTAEQTENGCIYTVKLPDVRCWTAVWVQLEE